MRAETLQVTGSVPEIVRNDAGLYEGNLQEYFKVLFHKARNLRAPYHNARHMLHVFYMCYRAIIHYRIIGQPLSEREARNLLVAALFHDFDHTARGGNDDLNIEFALRGLRSNILPVDVPYQQEIEQLILWTQYPYVVESGLITTSGQILRDADMSQAMSTAWIQQVIFGLAEEWGLSPMKVLEMQVGFHRGLKFHSHWGQMMFPAELVKQKIEEAEQLVELLSLK